jgi:hypothetical protein
MARCAHRQVPANVAKVWGGEDYRTALPSPFPNRWSATSLLLQADQAVPGCASSVSVGSKRSCAAIQASIDGAISPEVLIWRSAIRRAARLNLSSKGDSANGVCAALTPSYTLRLMSKNFGSPKRASRS